jgi:hypothetical protein
MRRGCERHICLSLMENAYCQVTAVNGTLNECLPCRRRERALILIHYCKFLSLESDNRSEQTDLHVQVEFACSSWRETLFELNSPAVRYDMVNGYHNLEP